MLLCLSRSSPVNAGWTSLAAPTVWAAAGCAVVLAVQVAASTRQQSGPPTFRAAVDLIAVDVQVVDRDGQPVAALGPERFSVSIDGHRRRVVSAEVVRVLNQPAPASIGLPPPGPLATN